MKKPNILFILSDDQGAWAMNCAGTKELLTPSLDKIAENGVRFTDFFCVSPVCSPARASILTGTIPSSHGVLDWIRSGNVDKQRFEEQGKNNPYGGYADEDKPIQYLAGKTTYTDILAQNGYSCAISGKWHLGDSVTPQHGFSRWYTIGKGGCNYFHPDMVENGEIAIKDGEYVTDLITDRAIEFMDELAAEDKPFYLSVHYTAPHSPWGAEHHKKEHIDYYDSCEFPSIPNVSDHEFSVAGRVYGTENRKEWLRGYFAAITAMDSSIGLLLDKLEQLNIAEDTIVIFAGDNGMSMGHHGIWGKGNGTFPMNMYDTSVKVPFLISYPPLIKKGVVSDNMVSAYDIFPTLLDLLGLDSSQTTRLPGKSFLPVLKGEQVEDDGAVVVYDEYGPVRMIRTKQYKFVARYPYGYDEFFDLVNDPNEEKNEIGNEKYSKTIVEYRRRMEKWFNDFSDPDIDATREGVTGSGQLCSAGVYAQKLKKYADPPVVTGRG